jgi:hypothetical protein
VASIFLSYKKQEDVLLGRMTKKLSTFRHEIRSDSSVLAAGQDWRGELFSALSTADAHVALLTRDALASPFILAEIGTSRAYQKLRGTLIIPVLIGLAGIPDFIRDIDAIMIPNDSDKELARAASSVDQAIKVHLKRLRGQYRSIFISHRHKDVELVRALTSLLSQALRLTPDDIRCTSVPPYKLRVGQRTPDRLRAEISRAKAVLGVVTRDTKESSYVLFELGAAWGQDVLTFPLLAKGASLEDIPSPISDRHPLQLAHPSECRQLVDDLADVLGRKPPAARGQDLDDAIRKLAREAAAPEHVPARAAVRRARAVRASRTPAKGSGTLG